jgi:hypothetical protein
MGKAPGGFDTQHWKQSKAKNKNKNKNCVATALLPLIENQGQKSYWRHQAFQFIT